MLFLINAYISLEGISVYAGATDSPLEDGKVRFTFISEKTIDTGSDDTRWGISENDHTYDCLYWNDDNKLQNAPAAASGQMAVFCE